MELKASLSKELVGIDGSLYFLYHTISRRGKTIGCMLSLFTRGFLRLYPSISLDIYISMQVSDRNGVHVPSRFMFVHFFFPLFILCFSFQYVNSLSTKTRNRNRDCDKLTFTRGFLFFFLN